MCDTCGCADHGQPAYDGQKAATPGRLAAAHGPMTAAEHEYAHAHGIPHDHAHPHPHPHDHGHGHPHEHPHSHPHDHGHTHSHDIVTRTVALNAPVLEHNTRLAERLRGFFLAKKLPVINVISSPGSGKTMLAEKTAAALGGKCRLGVIVGDLETDLDAQRLRRHGIQVVQVTTGTVCHLDAQMVAEAVERLDLDTVDLVWIENVGNLVCPASFDLGESLRVVLLSATEGEDKPLKYPPVFNSAGVVVISKTDLAGPADFNIETARENLRRVAPRAQVFELSALRGDGMDRWLDYVTAFAKRGAAATHG
jgi:hydrogenase nickel incorporation protein HypB